MLSSYPNAFVFEESQAVRRPTTEQVLAHVLRPGAGFEPGHPVLAFEAHPVEQDVPLPGFHLGAGCLFAPGSFVQAFPYDPWFYFHGEEQAMALRLFTHGWDIFHMPGLPVYHLYNNGDSGAPPRPLHWDAVAARPARDQTWWELRAALAQPAGGAGGRCADWASMAWGASARSPTTRPSAASTTPRGRSAPAPTQPSAAAAQG